MSHNILFLHIPKTAGQSVHEYLVSVFGETKVCPARVNGQLRQYEIAELQQYQVFSGHFDWKLLDFVAKPTFTFTILRDPIERIVSFYLYLRREAEKLDSQALSLPENSGKKAILSLTPDEYFADQTVALRNFIDDNYDNFYTYYFAGRTYDGRRSVLASLPDKLSQQDKAGRLVGLAMENLAAVDKVYPIHEWQQRLSDDLLALTGLERAKSCVEKRVFNINRGDSLDLEKRLSKMRELGATSLTFSTIMKFVSLDRILLDRSCEALSPHLYESFEILAKYGEVSESLPPLSIKENQEAEVKALISRAKIHYSQGDWQQIVDCLTQAVALQEDCWEAQQLLGDALLSLGHWEAAVITYRRALELNPTFDWTLHNLVIALNQLGQFEQAELYCDKLAEIYPEFWEANKLEFRQFPEALTPHEDEADVPVVELIEQLHWQQEQDLFRLLATALQNPSLTFLPEFQQLCWQLRTQLNSSKLNLEYGCWLAPGILYIEGNVEDCWILGETKALLLSPDGQTCEIAEADFFQTSHNQFSAVAVFNRDVYNEPFKAYCLTPFLNGTPVLIESTISQKAYSLELIRWMEGKPEYQKHLIRENISRIVIKLIPKNLQHEAGDLLYKLQHFLDVALSTSLDLKLPFKFFIEQVIPIKAEGIFLAGWMHDPHKMLEEVEVISALGFSIPILRSQVYRFPRSDVTEHLQNTPYGNFAGKLGFCAYVEIPEAISSQFEDFAELHSFRFKAKLKGRVEVEIIPDVKHHDAFTARQLVVQLVPPDEVDSAMLENCIAPAASKLQQICMQQVAVKEVVIVGSPIPEPLISIIIPLYKQLDFMKIQVATMADDSSIKERCEIIYVLDSPEQQKEVKEFLLDHCLVYELPVKLIIMEANSGYAAANNVGAAHARGEYLILLNSDVFHKAPGWAIKMAEFYAASPEIGTLAPKLIYEDDSIQHAGMYFERTKFPFWLTLHYYKGFPNSYELAQVSRSVPAVTGACLMIRRSLYERVGGMSTDYIIGDFEDSDLCFKCAELGYESWYFAGAELYHLERQSMPLSTVYSGSLAWQCNARIHEHRWKDRIKNLMQNCQPEKNNLEPNIPQYRG